MRLIELITDPASNQLSMSRLCLPVVVALDIGWVVTIVLALPPAGAVDSVSRMLGIVTGTICGVYGLSTVKTGGKIAERIRTIFQPAA